MVSSETIREATVITTEALLRGGDCLQFATAEAIDQRSITGFYTKPTNYTNVGVSVGRGARSPIEPYQQSVRHTDEQWQLVERPPGVR